MPFKSLFPQSRVSSGGSMVGLMAISSKRAYAIPRSAAPEPLPLQQATADTSTGDTQTQFWLSLCGVSGSWCAQGLFEPSKHLWRVWGLIQNVISPLLPSCWGSSFALGHGVSFLVGSNSLQSTLVQQCVVISAFSQEMSACSSLPSWRQLHEGGIKRDERVAVCAAGITKSKSAKSGQWRSRFLF